MYISVKFNKRRKHMNTTNIDSTLPAQSVVAQNETTTTSVSYTNKNEIGIKVALLKDYQVVKETLERIGVINKRKKEIYPSCYLRKYRDDYYICHFKEFFILQGKNSTINKTDLLRRSTIVYLLQKWGLIEAINPSDINKILHKKIDVLPYKDKDNYRIVHKYKRHRFV